MAKRRNIPLEKSLAKLLSLAPNDEQYKMLVGMGFKDSEINNGTVVTAALYQKASSGDNTAIKLLMELAGESERPASCSKLYKALEEDADCK